MIRAHRSSPARLATGCLCPGEPRTYATIDGDDVPPGLSSVGCPPRPASACSPPSGSSRVAWADASHVGSFSLYEATRGLVAGMAFQMVVKYCGSEAQLSCIHEQRARAGRRLTSALEVEHVLLDVDDGDGREERFGFRMVAISSFSVSR